MQDLAIERNLIYEAISSKFNGAHTTMTLRKINHDKQYGIWYSRIACLTADSNRIIVAIVPLEVYHTIDSTATLDQLKWTGFQTRETNDQQLLSSLQVQSCPVRPTVAPVAHEVLRKAVFKVVARGELAWSYVSTALPSLRVDLLKAKSDQEFRETGSIEQMLDIYQTCLAFML
jgi:hypothetical protein